MVQWKILARFLWICYLMIVENLGEVFNLAIWQKPTNIKILHACTPVVLRIKFKFTNTYTKSQFVKFNSCQTFPLYSIGPPAKFAGVVSTCACNRYVPGYSLHPWLVK